MTKLNKLSLALALATGAAVSVPAQAFTIMMGDYKMTIDGYTNGTLYGTTSCGNHQDPSDANVTACDLAQVAASKGSSGSEDAWGILSIASIVHTGTGTQYFTRGTDGYLIGYFEGLEDFYQDPTGLAGQETLSRGGSIDLFSAAFDYNPAIVSSNRTNVLNQFSGLDSWLTLDFVQGAGEFGYEQSAYTAFFNRGTKQGSGTGYLAVTGGAAAGVFDSNYYTTYAGLSADAYMSITIKPMTPNDAGQAGGWLAGLSADVRGTTVPEPGSLALLGLGLVGLAAARRRKAAGAQRRQPRR